MELFNAFKRIGIITQADPHEKHQTAQRVKSEIIINHGKREQLEVPDQNSQHEKRDNNDTTPHLSLIHISSANDYFLYFYL